MVEIGGKLFYINAIEAVVPIGNGESKSLIMLRSGASVTVHASYASIKAALTAPLIEGASS